MQVELASNDAVKFLRLTCVKCTREVSIMGVDREDCNEQAKRAGWVRNSGRTICGKCPAVRERAR